MGSAGGGGNCPAGPVASLISLPGDAMQLCRARQVGVGLFELWTRILVCFWCVLVMEETTEVFCGAKPFKGKGSRTNQPTKVWSTRILPASVPPSPSVRAPLPHSVPVPLLPAEKQRAGRAGPSSTHLAPLVVSCLTRPRIRDTSGASAGSDSEDACVHRRRLGRSTWLRADPAPERRGVAAASTSPGRQSTAA